MGNMKKVCKRCGELKEHTAHGLCHPCYGAKWRVENRERVAETKKKWYVENKERIGGCRKKWYAENKDQRKEYNKKWYIKNSDKIKEASKKWHAKNPDKAREACKKWCAKNPEYMRKWQKANPEKRREWYKNNLEKSREYGLKRRVNGEIKKGTISKLINENVFKYGIIACEACKKVCEDNYHIDHIKPISKGGSNEYGNLQILCAKCNLKKQAKEIRYTQDSKEKQLFLKEFN